VLAAGVSVQPPRGRRLVTTAWLGGWQKATPRLRATPAPAAINALRPGCRVYGGLALFLAAVIASIAGRWVHGRALSRIVMAAS
jgi:hypothetical protein